MHKFTKFVSSAFVAVGLFTLVATGVAPAFAAEGGGNGLKVSPVRTDLTIKPGESQTVTVNVQNVTSADATFKALINDFVAGGSENGQPNLILDATKYAPSHSLKRYVADVPDVAVPAGETKAVKVVIAIPNDAAGGGYFGAVRFVPAGSSSTDKNVTLSASVGSIILVKVPGDIKEDLQVASFDVRGTAESNNASSFYTSNKPNKDAEGNRTPLVAVVRFENKGDVQEQPFGKIVLKKNGKVLQTTEINNTDPKGNVLPDSIRRFSVPLDKVGNFGKYTVEGNFGYGSNGQLLSASSTFYVVPVGIIIAVLVAIGLIVLGIIFVPRAIKRYNARILRRGRR